MKTAYGQMAARATDAEKAGNHQLAVYWAGEAQKLKKYLMISGDMKNSVEITHAIQETNHALSDLVATAGAMDSALDPADPAALQAEVETLQSQAQIMLEQGSELFDALPDMDSTDSEAGEQYLQELMNSAHQEKRAHLIQDTKRKLDQMQRFRPVEPSK